MERSQFIKRIVSGVSIPLVVPPGGALQGPAWGAPPDLQGHMPQTLAPRGPEHRSRGARWAIVKLSGILRAVVLKNKSSGYWKLIAS